MHVSNHVRLFPAHKGSGTGAGRAAGCGKDTLGLRTRRRCSLSLPALCMSWCVKEVTSTYAHARTYAHAIYEPVSSFSPLYFIRSDRPFFGLLIKFDHIYLKVSLLLLILSFSHCLHDIHPLSLPSSNSLPNTSVGSV